MRVKFIKIGYFVRIIETCVSITYTHSQYIKPITYQCEYLCNRNYNVYMFVIFFGIVSVRVSGLSY